MNKAIVVGHLGHDVSLKTTQAGKNIGEFSLGETDYKNKNADGKPNTNWFSVSVFGEQAANCHKYIKKGSHVLVEGSLKIEKYTGKDGAEKTAVKLVANSVTFLDKKHSGEITDNEDPVNYAGIPNKTATLSAKGLSLGSDDDIPF